MSLSGVSSEFALLAAATRRPLSEDAFAALLAAHPINWHFLLSLASRHRVIGLLADALLLPAPAIALFVPPQERSRLEHARRQATLHELKMLASLKRMTEALQGVGVQPTLLKGLHVSARAYGRLGLRTNCDIDLLVKSTEVPNAEHCLVSLGYQRVTHETAPRDQLHRNQKDVSYFHPAEKIAVDLHWRLFHNPHLMHIEHLQLTRSEQIFGDIALQVLTPPANIVYLATHGAIHGWSRLKWLADFQALLFKEPRAGLASAHKLAAELGLTASLSQALALRAEIYGEDASMQPSKGFRVGLLKSLAILTMTRWGDREIESVWGGTKLKNASHYLLRMTLAHLLFEAAYDIDGRLDSIASAWRRKRIPGVRVKSLNGAEQ